MRNRSVRKSLIYLGFTILIAWSVLLRFKNLSSNPAGLFPDEASTGYDVWCLIHHGIDQHGQRWPFFFKSFADDLAGTYRYITLPFVLIWGLTPLAVRFPAALTGVLTILFFCRAVSMRIGTIPALITAFFLATSPWHLPYCRTGQRIMLLPFALSIWLWHRHRSEPELRAPVYSLNFFILGCSVYTYVAARMVIPLLAAAVLVFDLKPSRRNNPRIPLAVLVFLIALIPLIHHAATMPDLFNLRFLQVSIFSRYPQFGDAVRAVLNNYIMHFSPDFLFMNGDRNLRHSQQGIGMLFWSQIPFLLAGLGRMVRRHSPWDCTLLVWLAVSPLPAAISVEGNPHALRSVAMLLPCMWITAEGADIFSRCFSRLSAVRVITTVSLSLALLEGCWVSYDLINRYPVYSARAWEYGTAQAIRKSFELAPEYQEIWLSSGFKGADRVVAFILKLPPREFKESGLERTPFRYRWHIPVREIITMPTAKTRLFVIRAEETVNLPDVIPPLFFPDGTPAVRFVSRHIPVTATR
ncbi:glycosyltransferase family 39 protein [bacterium]|nr:glycosyltransferase family 39 protein [candidate division CSSED10-310 bacterium]